MVPGMAEQLRENLFNRVAKPQTFITLVFKNAPLTQHHQVGQDTATRQSPSLLSDPEISARLTSPGKVDVFL